MIKNWFMFSGLLVLLVLACTKDPSEEVGSMVDDNPGDESETDYDLDTATIRLIRLTGTTAEVTGGGASVDGDLVTVFEAGAYRITGNLNSGSILVKTDGIVQFLLDGVSITNPNGPAIYVDKAEKLVVLTQENTTNTLQDGQSYSANEDDLNATLYCKSYLGLSGQGELKIVGLYQDGINAKDGLTIQGGTYQVTAVDDGIRGKDFLYIHDGNFNITSGGDALKSDNEDDAALGYIHVTDGQFVVQSTGDALTASHLLTVEGGNFNITSGGGSSKKPSNSAKALKSDLDIKVYGGVFSINAGDDGLHAGNAIAIYDGQFSIATADDGLHADNTVDFVNGILHISKCEEGIETKTLTVNDGDISIASSDDGFNATSGVRTEGNDGSYIYIKGGHIALNATNGDPLDSNGNISMTGGTVIIHGPSKQPEVPIDYNGSFEMNGGFVIAAGVNSRMTQAFSNSSSQYGIFNYSSSTISGPSTYWHISTTDDQFLVSFQSERNATAVVFSSSELSSGSQYKIWTGGTVAGESDSGLVRNPQVSNAKLVKTFTLNSKVTSVSM